MSHGELLHLTQVDGRAIRLRRPPVRDAERVAGTYRALADATRLTLALALADGRELCVCDLAWIVERSRALVSHHMRELRLAGLVDARKEGKMTMYRLTPRGEALLALAARELAAT
jgi:DNA-binding transcriptional ArsR family regulator